MEKLKRNVKLTKDITKFRFDFSRLSKEIKNIKDTITITGTYTLLSTANTNDDMLALEVLEAKILLAVNKVTG